MNNTLNKEWEVAYEDPSTTLRCRALTTETFDLPIGVNLVVLQDGHLDLLALVLNLLGGLKRASRKRNARYHMKSSCTNVVGLLLSLLGTTTETKDQVECGLLLDVVITESAAVLKLLAGEDETLLVGRDASYLVSNE
jgi:hypothetical protein